MRDSADQCRFACPASRRASSGFAPLCDRCATSSPPSLSGLTRGRSRTQEALPRRVPLQLGLDSA
jgi:hypothetical protein